MPRAGGRAARSAHGHSYFSQNRYFTDTLWQTGKLASRRLDAERIVCVEFLAHNIFMFNREKIMPLKCLKLDMLKTFLSNFEHKLDNKPNGQSMYTFTNGFVLNVYETGSVVFQGIEIDGALAKQIMNFIDSVNATSLYTSPLSCGHP